MQLGSNVWMIRCGHECPCGYGVQQTQGVAMGVVLVAGTFASGVCAPRDAAAPGVEERACRSHRDDAFTGSGAPTCKVALRWQTRRRAHGTLAWQKNRWALAPWGCSKCASPILTCRYEGDSTLYDLLQGKVRKAGSSPPAAGLLLHTPRLGRVAWRTFLLRLANVPHRRGAPFHVCLG